jgi:hypothetical protein
MILALDMNNAFIIQSNEVRRASRIVTGGIKKELGGH